MRLFAAVLPPPRAADHLENALAVVRGDAGPGAGVVGRPGRTDGLRWTPPEDRHITVAFFGEVPEGYVPDVAGALDDVAAARPAFEASLRGAGLFDGRTLWIGCAGAGWTELMSAACGVGTELLGRAEDRRSRPHLTVARARGGGGGRSGGGRSGRRGAQGADGGGRRGPASVVLDPAALAHALALYSGPAWTVREVVLVSSRLGAGTGGSPQHDVVHRSALLAVAGCGRAVPD